MVLWDDREAPKGVAGGHADQRAEGPVQHLRLAERAAWQELQRLSERVTAGELFAATPAGAAQLARQREAYRRAQGAWRVARQALDCCLQGRLVE